MPWEMTQSQFIAQVSTKGVLEALRSGLTSTYLKDQGCILANGWRNVERLYGAELLQGRLMSNDEEIIKGLISQGVHAAECPAAHDCERDHPTDETKHETQECTCWLNEN